ERQSHEGHREKAVRGQVCPGRLTAGWLRCSPVSRHLRRISGPGSSISRSENHERFSGTLGSMPALRSSSDSQRTALLSCCEVLRWAKPPSSPLRKCWKKYVAATFQGRRMRDARKK